MDSTTEGRNLQTSQLVMQELANIQRCTARLEVEGLLQEILQGDPVSVPAIIKEITDSAARAKSLLLGAGGWNTKTALKPEDCPEWSVASPSSVDQRISVEVSVGKRKVSQSGDGGRSASRRRSQQHAGIRVHESKTLEDGYQWRKYGQKDILSSNHPRNYFRCTHKKDQGCQAQRQVQKSEADPSTYIFTYIGEHTCRDPALVPDHFISPSSSKGSCIISFGGNTIKESIQVTAVPSTKMEHEDDQLSNLTTGSSSSKYHELHEAVTPDAIVPVSMPPPPQPADADSLLPFPAASLSMDVFMTEGNYELDDLADFVDGFFLMA